MNKNVKILLAILAVGITIFIVRLVLLSFIVTSSVNPQSQTPKGNKSILKSEILGVLARANSLYVDAAGSTPSCEDIKHLMRYYSRKDSNSCYVNGTRDENSLIYSSNLNTKCMMVSTGYKVDGKYLYSPSIEINRDTKAESLQLFESDLPKICEK